ncbi:hypothetical protein J7E71_13045 [Mesobacillus foraminis]|uniref:hypothetical protein n=1 Tax=Mesobacillus foraminis TaxID=279826 RepID=UPI001BEACB99|nr:hypothetical protein [Mesobacillus foraminis]MBT2756873.1 hypothetical protein [Mesobacillus foraminis]
MSYHPLFLPFSPQDYNVLSKLKDLNVAKAAKMITNTYASAGWGITNVLDINFEDVTVIIKMKVGI